jgi:hypothetical protein
MLALESVSIALTLLWMAAAVLNTVGTLSHSPADNGSGILRHT